MKARPIQAVLKFAIILALPITPTASKAQSPQVPDWALPAYLVLTASLLAISIIDLEHFIVPDRITAPLTVSALALLGLAAAADGNGWRFGRSLLGGLAFFAFLLLLNIVNPRGMGMGDVKLSFSLGLFLGWLGWGQVFLGGFLSFLLGAVVGVALIATKVKGRKDHVPFGPFLAVGTLITILWGASILRWYTGSQLSTTVLPVVIVNLWLLRCHRGHRAKRPRRPPSHGSRGG